MKKFLSILLVGLLCVCCFALGACKEEGPTVETYKMSALVIAGQEYNVGDTVPGQIVSAEAFELTQDFFVLEFSSNGTVVSKMNGEASDVAMTWTKSGGNYVITQTTPQGEQTITCVIEGSNMTIDVTGQGTMIYKLVKA